MTLVLIVTIILYKVVKIVSLILGLGKILFNLETQKAFWKKRFFCARHDSKNIGANC